MTLLEGSKLNVNFTNHSTMSFVHMQNLVNLDAAEFQQVSKSTNNVQQRPKMTDDDRRRQTTTDDDRRRPTATDDDHQEIAVKTYDLLGWKETGNYQQNPTQFKLISEYY